MRHLATLARIVANGRYRASSLRSLILKERLAAAQRRRISGTYSFTGGSVALTRHATRCSGSRVEQPRYGLCLAQLMQQSRRERALSGGPADPRLEAASVGLALLRDPVALTLNLVCMALYETAISVSWHKISVGLNINSIAPSQSRSRRR